jgi:uracil-DNA glycosylase family 4
MTTAKPPEAPCWRGKDVATPFVPGIPAEVPRFRSAKQLFSTMQCCTRCELALGRTQVVLGTGSVTASLMFVGEAPGEKEDAAGRPFVGNAGRLLDRLLEEVGIGRSDVFITNIVACRPPRNRTPKVKEVKAHAPWLDEQLRLVKPEVVVTLGRVALTYFVPKAKVGESRGKSRRLERNGQPFVLLPTFHPAAVLRDYEVLYPTILSDFKKIARLLK